MGGDLGNITDADKFDDGEFTPAYFECDLRLPPAEHQLLHDAATAVRQEYRECSKWKQLTCRKVSIFAERERGSVYVVHVGKSVEFDWSWEGATAFRPMSIDDNPMFLDHFVECKTDGDEVEWQGEILEVDERNGCLYISLDKPEAIPTIGSFYVRPFEFLSVLDAVYNDPMFETSREGFEHRLAATLGGIHPSTAAPGKGGLPELESWWRHSWNILWGPPGTGKTYITGRQIAAVLADPDERILVVSTTNRATDAVAISIGNAARDHSSADLETGNLVRIGRGASQKTFAANDLEMMLCGTESEVMTRIDELAGRLPLFDSWEDKALTRKEIGKLRSLSGNAGSVAFVDPEVRVIVATAYMAMTNLKRLANVIEAGGAPFTTIFIDEAGLISRTAIAALSLLAANRVVLVGDSKQLAPISRISRILPARQRTWLASSGLSHLDELTDTPAAVHVLSEQRRMHPDVCDVVSQYQYGGVLTTAEDTQRRPTSLPASMSAHSRATWYVLDEENADLASIRAGRGPGNKSWVRPITESILQKLFSCDDVAQSNGLFISPYKAQAQAVAKLFVKWGLSNWESSTVHSQQGSEADIVIFDTVNAGSYNWPFEEWKRLINVALSRAKEAVIVLASRSEMEEPYLRSLLNSLTPSVLIREGNTVRWETVSQTQTTCRRRQETFNESTSSTQPALQRETIKCKDQGMGKQFAERKEMTPVLSREQQRLVNLNLDGKPRLVRGVAGSGKSFVLCNWIAKTAMKLTKSEDHIWAVYANRSLHKLLQVSVESAWESILKEEMAESRAFPWERVSLLHVKDVLTGILPSASLSMDAYGFNYDRAAEEFLNRHGSEALLPRCSALFIDEAQDMGPNTLKLLLAIIEQTDTEDPNSRSAHVFYDNAQNIYGRKTPKWSEFGIDMRGRSTIMRESFRSTTPITELAVNVLHRLLPADQQADQDELLAMGLIETTTRNGEDWRQVRFNNVDGPKPIFRGFGDRDAEIDGIFAHLKYLMENERIAASDVCIIYNGKSILQALETKLKPRVAELGVELSVQTNRPFERKENTLIVTTSHSYKGYESEVVMIPGVDQFVTAGGDILANNLYVAMTRARSLLAIYGIDAGTSASRQVTQTLAACVDAVNARPKIEQSSIQDDQNDLLETIGTKHRKWLVDLWRQYDIRQEPITDSNGNLLSQPLFWFNESGVQFACYLLEDTISIELRRKLSANGVQLFRVGERLN